MPQPHRLSDLIATVKADLRHQWETAGRPGTFDTWKTEKRAQELREEEAREQAERRAARRLEAIARLEQQTPARFRDATVTDPGVRGWCERLLATEPATPLLVHGPSLLVLGITGVGKTYEAFGALRLLAERGLPNHIQVVVATDMYARLRPRSGVDSEAEFEKLARAGLLFVDDIGAAKSSEWIEEINYRLVNARYNDELPTVFTTNVPPKDLPAALGERVMSRLIGMSTRAVLKGNDRRRAA